MRGFPARGILSLRALNWGAGSQIGLFGVRLWFRWAESAIPLQTAFNVQLGGLVFEKRDLGVARTELAVEFCCGAR